MKRAWSPACSSTCFCMTSSFPLQLHQRAAGDRARAAAARVLTLRIEAHRPLERARGFFEVRHRQVRFAEIGPRGDVVRLDLERFQKARHGLREALVLRARRAEE